MIYKARQPQFIQALQYKNIHEHSTDFQIVRVQSSGNCTICHKPLNSHGLLNNNLICPTHYIVYEGTQIVNVLSKEQFETAFEPVGEIVLTID